jgi:hypothetical protein
MEAKLSVKSSKKGDKVYNNLNLKEDDGNGTYLLVDNHIIVKKSKYAAGMAKEGVSKFGGTPYKYFICNVEYDGKECSFLLYEKDHEKWASTGGVDDKVKISAREVPVVQNKQKKLVFVLDFEKVN